MEPDDRLYDPLVGRFLSPDNFVQASDFTQSFNRYAYCLNNPLVYTDPDGEFVWLIPALIGGAINVATHWNSLHGRFWDKVGQGALYFGTGAVQGGLAVLGPVGWATGGAFSGAANAAIGGTNGSQILQQGIIGGISGLAGGAFGKWAGQNLGGVVINGFHVSANSAIGGAVTGAIGGAAGGYAGGFTGGFLMTGNLGAAHQAGMAGLKTGAAIGGGIGAAYGYYSAEKAGRNPWTGRPNKSAVIGGPQDRVDQIGKLSGSETIRNNSIQNWPEDMPAYLGKDVPNPNALEFNQIWMEQTIRAEYYIYDAGRSGYSPFYNGIELPTIQQYNYGNVYRVTYYQTIRVLIIYK